MTEPPEKLDAYAELMKRDWDDRARSNARWFINTVKLEQSDHEFEATGLKEVELGILEDWLVTSFGNLKSMRLLEIGCGIGRMTRHLAPLFAQVHGVDVSGEMIRQARERLRDFSNVFLYETKGLDFAVLPSDYFDLAFSVYVFQHVPSIEVIRSNIKDACRVLRPGGLFKFQTNGIVDQELDSIQKDTWTGVTFPETEIRGAARDFGLQVVRITGSGQLYCGATLRKPPARSTSTGFGPPRIEFFGRTSDGREKTIPTTGTTASLTLIVSGVLPDALDCNTIHAEIAGKLISPCYAGRLEDKFNPLLPDSLSGAIQVDFPISSEVPTGLNPVRVRIAGTQFSAPVEVEFLQPQPLAPRILYASNVVDGGVDIYTGGDKSRFRVFVYDLGRDAQLDHIRLKIGEWVIVPQEVSFVATNGFSMIVAQLPESITSGNHQLKVVNGVLESEARPLEVLSAKC